MNSGKIILIEQCRAVCGPPGIAFSQMELGRQGADAAPASYGSGGVAGEELALSASLRSAALPKGEPLAWRQGFQFRQSLSLWERCHPQVTERVPSREKVDRENPQIFPIYKL
jgi:hypothetical protein